MKAVLKYPGSKWGIADWIIKKFPEHHSYLEPYFGSGAVFFNKERSDIETINDIDGDVTNLFACIREDPERLAYLIYFTPYSREVYDSVFSEKANLQDDTYTKALRFAIRLNMGQGFRTRGGKTGWKDDIQGRERAYSAKDWCSLPERILDAAERLRGVQIENCPAVELIKRFNYQNVLIYCDPPYLLETRAGRQYKYEMELEQHIELLQYLKAHKGQVLLSGYESDLYNTMLTG